ncbi:phosphatase PAP2 family protein [Isoptericola sp. b441]|uniref:Phosphatase PAP2 family protein n=1 Tax=Actinotalea lenta TaxID=3064654 RepID=A0ABT9D9K2_9CELL|nr:phosphatase PAP2 family protein [Isoptericola sp. b441]MDO8107166.1 phosphatase PAP2 family protein [Isoptericola sp. b441]
MIARLRDRLDATTALPVAVVLLAGLTTASLLDGVRESGDLATLDQPMLTWVLAHRLPVMTTVSLVGGEVVMSAIAVLTVAVLAWRRRYSQALVLGGALALAEGLSVVVKHVVGRSRPPSSAVIGPVERTLSFPSGHTIGTATFALAVAYLWWRARPRLGRALLGLAGAGAATALMAASRLYLADHWLTDVLASTALAAAVIAVVVLLDQRWRRTHPSDDTAAMAP